MADRMTLTEDFNRAHRHALFQQLFSTFRWSKPDLLSFYEVTKLIKPEAEAYKGMRVIPVNKIIGSESRYHDFSSAFYPKSTHLQARWESIDAARLDEVTLPPISVYKLGEWYFVRDGNHRVSVSRSKGVEFIDAEVVELTSKIPLEEGITLNEIKRRVVAYERQRFLDQFNPTYLPMASVCEPHPVHLAAVADGHEEEDVGFQAALLPHHAGIAHAVTALVAVKRRLARLPARIPDSVAVLDVVIAPAVIHRHAVVAVPQDPAELGVLAEAVAAGRVGDQGEEILRSHIVDPGPRGGRVRDDVLAECVIEMSEFFHCKAVSPLR